MTTKTGNVYIVDSNVNINSADGRSIDARSYETASYETKNAEGSEVKIVNSNVTVNYGIRAWNGIQTEGKITLIDFEFVSLEDAEVVVDDFSAETSSMAITIKATKKEEKKDDSNKGIIASNTSNNLVQTGVMSNMSLYVTGSIAAAGVASIFISFKKRK